MNLKPYEKVESWTEENKLQIVENEVYYFNDFKKIKDFLRSKKVKMSKFTNLNEPTNENDICFSKEFKNCFTTEHLIYLNSIDSESKFLYQKKVYEGEELL